MSDKMRWRYGNTNSVAAAVDSETVVEIGDLLWQGLALDPLKTWKEAYPASDLAQPPGNVEEKQRYFADNFLGVAMERSRSGDTDPVRVATTGVFEFDCPSGTFELGGFVGVDEASSGTALEDQQVASVAASKYAIARVAKRVATAASSVLVDIRSTVVPGGIKGTSGV